MPLAILTGAMAVLGASSAHAGLGTVHAAIEPSVAQMQPPSEDRIYGYGGGAALEVGLGDQLSFSIFGNDQHLPSRDPSLRTRAVGGTLLYRIDAFDVAPYVELGLASVKVTPAHGQTDPASLLTVLGLGFEVIHFDRLLWGLVMRYYPLFETDLLSAPAFATLHLRIGVALDWSK